MKETTKVFVVYGSYGELVIDQCGHVIDNVQVDTSNEGGKEYAGITRFDLREFHQFWGDRCWNRVSRIDICDIGFWTANGCYISPEWSYRLLMIEFAGDSKVHPLHLDQDLSDLVRLHEECQRRIEQEKKWTRVG